MIGNTLKQRREAKGLDLREVADTLKVRCDYLKSLEDTTTDTLPADIYARGHLRQYAQLLGVDLESLVEPHSEEHTAHAAPSDAPVSQPKAGFRVSRIVVATSAVLVIGGIVFAALSMRTGPQEERVAPPQVVPQAEQTAPVAPAPAPTPTVPPLEQDAAASQEMGQRYTLVVKADETTWLRVDMGEGKAEEALLKSGEEKEWASQNGFDLRVGNAGGIKVLLNGKEVEPLGKKGQVVRIKLPREFAAGTAAR